MDKGKTTKADDINNVAVIGAGIMGEGIAQNFAQAGLSVNLVDQEQEILDLCLTRIDASLRLFRESGLLREEPSSIKERIRPFELNELDKATGNCHFIVEAIPEVLQLKRDLLARLDKLSPEIIISSNTSSFTISALSEGMHTPGRVVGLHYFNPASIIPLVEIHRGRDTDDESVNRTRELMLRVGKKPVLVRKEIPGFIVNRIQAAMAREIEYLIGEEVVTPEDMDIAAKASYGFRLACLGPMETNDMQGLDTLARAGGQLMKTLCNRTEPSPALLERVARGELGIKTGKGWLDYTGRSRDEIIEERTRKLLKQLVSYRENE